MEKKQFRNIYKEKTKKLGENARIFASQEILKKLKKLSIYKNSRHIFVFVGIEEEVDTETWIPSLLSDGKRISVPFVEKGNSHMIATEIFNSQELEDGFWGLRQIPKGKIASRTVEDFDLILVPGLAFSMDGYRVGYGGGFYDRFLKKYPQAKTLGIGFHIQLTKDVPKNSYDVPLHGFLSEEEYLLFSSSED